MFEFPIYTVYDHPSDYPDHFVVRKWLIKDGGITEAGDIVKKSKNYSAIRNHMLDRGLHRLMRNEGDDPCIMECWI